MRSALLVTKNMKSPTKILSRLVLRKNPFELEPFEANHLVDLVRSKNGLDLHIVIPFVHILRNSENKDVEKVYLLSETYTQLLFGKILDSKGNRLVTKEVEEVIVSEFFLKMEEIVDTEHLDLLEEIHQGFNGYRKIIKDVGFIFSCISYGDLKIKNDTSYPSGVCLK